MITRIKINGFKSLLDTELFFGPFTCIAGANAIGKSNLFDAITFLSKLSDNTILQAAKSIRSENQKHSNIKDIFFKSGSHYLDKMSFDIDMIVPVEAEDDLGQKAVATITSLNYKLELKLNENNEEREPIEIVEEYLIPITQTDTRKKLYFGCDKSWIDSILRGRRGTNNPFISTEGDKIKLHQDGGKGRSTEFIAEKMPRTLLSTVTAESPTAFLVRQEMRNWIMLQFEPSALRQPNSIFEVKNAKISANGFNVPATLYRLQNEKKERDIYQLLTNKVKELVSDVDEIYVEKDEKRDLLTLQIRFKDGLVLPAQSLSDGTLRFLGLAVIREDSEHTGMICLEEPENGMNPQKIEEMVNLLEDMVTDTECPVNDDNPLRQMIINSHSPKVVNVVSDESLYLATEEEIFLETFGIKVKHTRFSALSDTWRTKFGLAKPVLLQNIIAYLEVGVIPDNDNFFVCEPQGQYGKPFVGKRRRSVAENIYSFQQKIPFQY